MSDHLFPPLRDLFPTVFGVTTAHHPAPVSHPTPALPTEPGLYVARGDSDLTGATVYLLDRNGFWWSLIHQDVTAEEVRANMGPRELERLVRHSETDQ